MKRRVLNALDLTVLTAGAVLAGYSPEACAALVENDSSVDRQQLLVVGQTPRIVVGPDVHVSAMRPNVHHREVVLALDDEDRMLACGMTDYGTEKGSEKDRTLQCYASFDKGNTWSYSDFNGKSVGDPAVAFGLGQEAYVVGWGGPEGIHFQRSTDRGKSFEYVSTILQQPLIDRPWIAVDRTSGANRGLIYVLGNEEGLYTSANKGKSFDKHNSVEGGSDLTMLDNGSIATLTKHKLPDRDPNISDFHTIYSLKYVVISEGGNRVEVRGEVAKYLQNPAVNGMAAPQVVVDQSEGPFRGKAYAVWADTKSGRPEVLVASSSDGGRSWSKPITISDYAPSSGLESSGTKTLPHRTARPNPEAVGYIPGVETRNRNAGRGWPAISVNHDGVVAVTWYEFHDMYTWHLRGAVSVDGGEIFSPSFAISKPVNALEVGNKSLFSVFGTSRLSKRSSGLYSTILAFTGHTAGLVADTKGVFHALYVDSRTGENQIWTAPIKVAGSATKNGSPALNSLQDVSSNVNERISDYTFDRDAGELTVKVAFTNVGKTSLKGPLVVRVRNVRNDLARAQIINADNGVTGRSASWSFETESGDGLLLPGATTRPRNLKFKLEMPNDDPRPDSRDTGAMTLDWIVLGRQSGN